MYPEINNQKPKPRISYVASQYRSFSRVAADYRALLQRQYEVTSLPDSPVVILHSSPDHFPLLYRRIPLLTSRYVIAYCVWETDRLPPSYVEGVKQVQEIWTCSEYCRTTFARYKDTSIVIPHVISRRGPTSDKAVEKVKRLVAFDPGKIYYLTITNSLDTRKNVATLVDAFRSISTAIPTACLIVKDMIRDSDFKYDNDRIIHIRGDLSWEEITALYEIAQVYVSAHHSEAWGLALSDAMLCGKIVIASGYSGNLTYMNSRNSVLVKTKEDYIQPGDEYYLFDRTMRWGYPDKADLKEKLIWAYERQCADLTNNATSTASMFNDEAVARLIFERLASIGLRPD